MKSRYYIPILLISTAAGTTCGYYIAKTKYEKQAQEDINNYKASLKSPKGEKLVELPKDYDGPTTCEACKIDIEEPKEDLVEVMEELIQEKKYAPEQKPKHTKEQIKRKEEKQEKKYKKHLDYDPEEEDLNDEENIPGPSEGLAEPYVITYMDYAESNYHYDKVTLIYYDESDVLVYADTNEMVHDDVALCGDCWRNYIGEDVPETGYIRNENLSSDFEILVRHAEYTGE